jgi:trigger factor
MKPSFEIENLSSVQKKVRVTIPAKLISDRFEKRLGEVAKQASLKGFRKGFAPISMVRSTFGGEVREGVLNSLIDESFQTVVKENNFRVAGQPRLAGDKSEQIEINEGKDIVFTATVDLFPEVDVKDYLGLELKKVETSVDEKEVEQVIQNILDRRAELIPTEEGTKAAAGNFVDFEFEGKIKEGSEWITKEDLKGQRFLQLGSGELLTEFEEALTGLKAGDQKDFKLEYPKEYAEPSLAGKEARFTLKLHDVKEKKLPELTEEVAKELGHESVAKLREVAENSMKRVKGDEANRQLKSQVIQALVEKYKFDVPQSAVAGQLELLMDEYRNELQGRGYSDAMMASAVQKNLENLQKRAEVQVKSSLILDNIAVKEKIQVTNEDATREIRALAFSMNTTEQDVRAQLERSRDARMNFEFRIREEKTLDFLIGKAKLK